MSVAAERPGPTTLRWAYIHTLQKRGERGVPAWGGLWVRRAVGTAEQKVRRSDYGQ